VRGMSIEGYRARPARVKTLVGTACTFISLCCAARRCAALSLLVPRS